MKFVSKLKTEILFFYLNYLDELMKTCNKCIKCKQHKKGKCEEWSPLLLIIPLRLGLNEFNQDYTESLKVLIFQFEF